MSKRSSHRGTGGARSTMKARPLATAVAISGAGVVLAFPAAALLATPGVANATPSQCQLPACLGGAAPVTPSIFGASFAPALVSPVADPVAGLNPLINLAG
ncbi:MAG TPA: hypothetical protein VF477_13780, partial [Mycobacterium sp.]